MFFGPIVPEECRSCTFVCCEREDVQEAMKKLPATNVVNEAMVSRLWDNWYEQMFFIWHRICGHG